MTHATTGLTFQIPFINHEVKISLSPDQLGAMNAKVREVIASRDTKFDEMHETILKVTPIVLGILSVIILFPLWMPVAMLSSFVLGPVTWILAGVAECAVWNFAKKAVNSFQSQCPEIVDYAAASLVMMGRNVAVETSAAPTSRWMT